MLKSLVECACMDQEEEEIPSKETEEEEIEESLDNDESLPVVVALADLLMVDVSKLVRADSLSVEFGKRGKHDPAAQKLAQGNLIYKGSGVFELNSWKDDVVKWRKILNEYGFQVSEKKIASPPGAVFTIQKEELAEDVEESIGSAKQLASKWQKMYNNADSRDETTEEITELWNSLPSIQEKIAVVKELMRKEPFLVQSLVYSRSEPEFVALRKDVIEAIKDLNVRMKKMMKGMGIEEGCHMGESVNEEAEFKNLKVGGGKRLKQVVDEAVAGLDDVVKKLTGVDHEDISAKAGEMLVAFSIPLIDVKRKLLDMRKKIEESVETEQKSISEALDKSLVALKPYLKDAKEEDGGLLVVGKEKSAVIGSVRKAIQDLKAATPSADSSFQWHHRTLPDGYQILLLPG